MLFFSPLYWERGSWLSFPTSEGFVWYNGLHEPYLRELGGQTDFKDFSTLAAGTKMDIINYQPVSESFQSRLPGPLSRNASSSTNGGAGVRNPLSQGNGFFGKVSSIR